MPDSFAELFKQYLKEKEISPQTFSMLSGMPLTEVQSLLRDELPNTYLRANHLAAVFDTDVDRWLTDNQNEKTNQKN